MARAFLVFDVSGDVLHMGRFQVRDGEWLFPVQSQDFEPAGCADGEGRMEEIDAAAFGWDVEFVVLAEEFGIAALETWCVSSRWTFGRLVQAL